MKQTITLLTIALLACLHAHAQVPAAFNYQAIARDSFGHAIANSNVSFRLTVSQDVNPGTPQYTEVQNATTNQFGLATLKVGMGTPTFGSFSAINWSTANTYLLVEFDPAGGTNFMNMGSTQLLSVPYALYSGQILNDTTPGGGGGTGSRGGWLITGNTGTNYGTNFIGTTDAQNLAFKVNNRNAGFIEDTSNNTALGVTAANANTSGTRNTAIGFASLLVNSSGSSNVAVGASALVAGTTGDYNTALGANSLNINNSGAYNTAVGGHSLTANVAGSYNTALGYNAYNSAKNFNNSTAIGYAANVDSSNQIVVGNSSVTSIGGQVGWTSYSDGRVKNNIQANVPGLAFINALRPVTYNFDVKKEESLLGITTKDFAGKYDIEKTTFSGFIAQEVDQVAQQMGYNFSGVDKRSNIWGIRYTDFVPAIVKAVQEQQTTISEQQKQIDELKQQLNELKGALSTQGSTTR